ncbi:MAG: DUF2752 domain-containing protein [Oscillospiraceae bacterium]|nr:DUF2752 domain-containing protein [Oscillospiraceae bacterium]
MKQNKNILRFHFIFFAAIALYMITGSIFFDGCCPLRVILNIECPFCGMTTAYFRLLKGDLKGAFEAHSLFFIGVPFILIIAHFEVLKKRFGVFVNIISGIMIVLLVVRYIIRIRSGQIFLSVLY